MKTYRVFITVKQDLEMQLSAKTESDAEERAERLIESGSYYTIDDNCYDSEVKVKKAEEIIDKKEVDENVVSDNDYGFSSLN